MRVASTVFFLPNACVSFLAIVDGVFVCSSFLTENASASRRFWGIVFVTSTLSATRRPNFPYCWCPLPPLFLGPPVDSPQRKKKYRRHNSNQDDQQ